MPKRVLHLLSQKPGWTGSGMALDAMVRLAAESGWEQRVAVGVSAHDPSPAVGDLEAAHIDPLVFESELLPFLVPGMSDVMPYPSSRFSAMTRGEVGRYFSAWMEHISRLVTEFQPQVIHSHHVWVMSSLVKSIASSIPVVNHCHGTGLRQMELCPALAEEVRAGCSRNDAFVALHQEHSAILRAQLGVDANRISIVGNGFRDDVFYEPERPVVGPTITYAGKLSRAKGLPWLIKAVEKLALRNSGIVLHVAGSGSGPEADAIRRQIDLSERVVFYGQIDQHQLANLFRKSTVFVLPSFYEGLPLVLVEAAACGCRLVATRLPGVVHELEPPLGELLELVDLPRLERMDTPVAEDLPAFVDNLAAAIHRSLSKPPPEETSGHVHSMTWQAVFERIEHVWLRHMQPQHPSPVG